MRLELEPITGVNTTGSGSNAFLANGSNPNNAPNAADLNNPQLTSRGLMTAKTRRQGSVAQDIGIGFKNLTSGVGYNLTLPAGTCASTVVPPFLDPSTNNTVTNGTLADFWYAYSMTDKTSDEWKSFIRSQIEGILSTFASHIDTGSCGGELKLKEKRAAGILTRSERKDLILYQRQPPAAEVVQPQRSRYRLGTGFWTFTFLATGMNAAVPVRLTSSMN